VDATDLGIVRWMYPDGLWGPWGVDPRITPEQIGRRVGLGRTAVWSRVRHWLREGFLKPYEVRPNYRLFDAGLESAEIHLTDPVDAKGIMEDLQLVEGVTSAWLAFGDSDSAESAEVLSVCFVDDDPRAVGHRMRVFRRLSTEGVVDGPYPYRVPDVSRKLSALDWRIIATLRANPRASLSRVARLQGITLKTLIRRRDALLEAKAIFYHCEFDWSMHPSVSLLLFYKEPHELPTILRNLDDRFQYYLPGFLDDVAYYRHRLESVRFLGVRVPARSPDDVQPIMIDLMRIPGVLRVRCVLQGPSRYYPRWVDQRLAVQLAGLQIGTLPSPRSRGSGSAASP
jgi:DNA-binding Lrp family transcriptional regulator